MRDGLLLIYIDIRELRPASYLGTGPTGTLISYFPFHILSSDTAVYKMIHSTCIDCFGFQFHQKHCLAFVWQIDQQIECNIVYDFLLQNSVVALVLSIAITVPKTILAWRAYQICSYSEARRLFMFRIPSLICILAVAFFSFATLILLLRAK